MYKYPYAIIKKKLAAIAEIKEVAWYLQQDIKKGGIKILPAAYIRFLPTSMRSLGNGVQEGDLEFEVILITDNMYDNDKRIDDGTDTTHMDLLTSVHTTLSGKIGMLSDLTAFVALKDTENDVRILNTIDRSSISPPHEMRSLMKSTQRFKSYVKDPSGSPAFTAVTKGLEIESFEI